MRKKLTTMLVFYQNWLTKGLTRESRLMERILPGVEHSSKFKVKWDFLWNEVENPQCCESN